MQKAFHGQFSSKDWAINSIEETKPNVVVVDYDFAGKKLNGETVNSSGIETIVLKNGKIVRIEIRNKSWRYQLQVARKL